MSWSPSFLVNVCLRSRETPGDEIGRPAVKRILEESPVKGYQLYRWEKRKPDGSVTVLPNFYVRHNGKDTCTKTDRLLKEAKIAVTGSCPRRANPFVREACSTRSNRRK